MPRKANGPLRPDEVLKIEREKDERPVEEIAAELGRAPKTVRQRIGLSTPSGTVDLTDGSQWEFLRETFSKDEQAFFRRTYTEFCQTQLEGDVLPMEEVSLREAVTLTILIKRNLARQKELNDDIERVGKYRRKLEEEVNRAYREMTEEEQARFNAYRVDINEWKRELASLGGQYTEYTKERGNIMKALRTNRDQRVKDVESGQLTFVGLVKALGNKDRRDQEGRMAELLKLAVLKERERLMEPRVYPDGAEDFPLLSAETLELYDEEAPEDVQEGVKAEEEAGPVAQDEAVEPI